MSLTTSLVSYWKLDEASGTRNDSHGSNNLTDNNTVGSTTGKINNAGSFNSPNNESLSHVSNTDLQTGDIDFTITSWVNLATKQNAANIVAKRGDPGSLEYYLRYVGSFYGFDKFNFEVSADGGTGTLGDATASNFGSPSTSTWYFVVCWHDSVNNVVGISVNDGTPNTAAYSSGVYVGTSPFMIGSTNATAPDPWDGFIDEVGFWKRVLTGAEITQLYNGGSGFAYPFSGVKLRRTLSQLGTRTTSRQISCS